MLDDVTRGTLSVLGYDVPRASLGETVLALAVRTYLDSGPSAREEGDAGHTDHDDHSDHSDCLCVIAGL